MGVSLFFVTPTKVMVGFLLSPQNGVPPKQAEPPMCRTRRGRCFSASPSQALSGLWKPDFPMKQTAGVPSKRRILRCAGILVFGVWSSSYVGLRMEIQGGKYDHCNWTTPLAFVWAVLKSSFSSQIKCNTCRVVVGVPKKSPCLGGPLKIINGRSFGWPSRNLTYRDIARTGPPHGDRVRGPGQS